MYIFTYTVLTNYGQDSSTYSDRLGQFEAVDMEQHYILNIAFTTPRTASQCRDVQALLSMLFNIPAISEEAFGGPQPSG